MVMKDPKGLWQPIFKKEISELKPVLPRLKIDLEMHSVHGRGVG